MNNIIKDVSIINQDFSFDYKILHCGIETQTTNAYLQTIDRFVFNYVIDGEGKIVIENKSFSFKKGDIFYIPANTNFFQINSQDNPYSYYFIALYGPNLNYLFKKAQLTPSHPVLTTESDIEANGTKQIFNLLKQPSFSTIAQANCIFIEMLCDLFSKNPENNLCYDQQIKICMEQVLFYIEQHSFENIQISNISKALHFNRTYLSTLFKKEYGISIKDYLTNYKINKAMHLMQNSDMTIAKIAHTLGFNDYANFYRVFNKHVGFTPKDYLVAYRKQNFKK